MGGLSFLSPLYLLGILAIAVPIALHLFRRRTDAVVDFPAVRLLTGSPVEQQRRRRLRELILLALRVTALVLLAGAFARPYLADSLLGVDTPITVVAVDRSFSLSAPGVFDRAREAAAAAVNDAPSGHAVAVVAFDDAAETVLSPTTDRGAARAAINGLTPGVLGTRYAALMARAADVLGPRGGRLVVVTDLQQQGWQGPARGSVPEDVEVTVVPIEAPLRNLAVLTAERRGERIEATVRNFGLDARSVTATLSVDGQERARATVELAAQASAPIAFDEPVPGTGEAVVAIADEGGVPADDARYLVLDPPTPTRVLVLVADPTSLGGGLYVERALSAATGGVAFTVTVVDGRALSAWTGEQLAEQQALIVLGTRSLDRRGRELVSGYISRGGSALVALGPEIDVAALGELLGAPASVAPEAASLGAGGATLIVEDSRHPILRPFASPAAALGDVSFQQYRAIKGDQQRVLARFSGGAAALVEQPRPAGRLLFFASDLDNRWNRFPLSPAFVPFVVESAKYLTEARREAGAWVLPDVPAGVEPRPGVYQAGSSGQGRRVAVNVNVEESNLAAMSREEFVAAVPRVARTAQPDAAGEARKAEDDQRLWQWGLLVMFLALAGEGFVGRRVT